MTIAGRYNVLCFNDVSARGVQYNTVTHGVTRTPRNPRAS